MRHHKILNELFLQVKRQDMGNLLLKELMKECRMYWRVGRAKKQRKEGTVYNDEEQAAIRKYVTENGNASTQKHFKKRFTKLGESTVHSFKQKYLSLIASRKSSVTSIPSKCIGRALVLGDFDQVVQKYKCIHYNVQDSN